MYIHRICEKTLLNIGSSFPCLAVYGPRQVGKSTTVSLLFSENCRRVNLDDADDRMLAEANPKLFLETYGWPLMIDEIQKVPKLLDEIKIKIDNQRLKWLKDGEKRQLMYILTGSNRFELQQGISDSLAGRCGIVEMSSFSQQEKYGYNDGLFVPQLSTLLQKEKCGRPYRTKQQIFEDIFTGGMPDIVTGVAEPSVYYKSYVNTYIERDVMKLIQASNELQFRSFLSVIALRTAQELHYNEIAGDVGIDTKTCKRWISILQSSGIIYLLQPYMANISNRIIKAPKLYFTDTGLCAYLCKWPNAEMLEHCAMNGAFFETFVVSEILKNRFSHNKEPGDCFFYYRDIDKKEIDLLYVDADSVTPIEIKNSPNPTKPTKNFDTLNKYHLKVNPGFIIEPCDKIRPINEQAFTFPVYLL